MSFASCITMHCCAHRTYCEVQVCFPRVHQVTICRGGRFSLLQRAARRCCREDASLQAAPHSTHLHDETHSCTHGTRPSEPGPCTVPVAPLCPQPPADPLILFTEHL